LRAYVEALYRMAGPVLARAGQLVAADAAMQAVMMGLLDVLFVTEPGAAPPWLALWPATTAYAARAWSTTHALLLTCWSVKG
jgi:hypothetical protein